MPARYGDWVTVPPTTTLCGVFIREFKHTRGMSPEHYCMYDGHDVLELTLADKSGKHEVVIKLYDAGARGVVAFLRGLFSEEEKMNDVDLKALKDIVSSLSDEAGKLAQTGSYIEFVNAVRKTTNDIYSHLPELALKVQELKDEHTAHHDVIEGLRNVLQDASTPVFKLPDAVKNLKDRLKAQYEELTDLVRFRNDVARELGYVAPLNKDVDNQYLMNALKKLEEGQRDAGHVCSTCYRYRKDINPCNPEEDSHYCDWHEKFFGPSFYCKDWCSK
jgi:rubrerythrin